MTFLAEIRVGDVRLGGKARSLADLAAVGLPTPPGFAVLDQVFRALCPEQPAIARLDAAALARLERLGRCVEGASWPPGFEAELEARLSGLAGARLAVRSSFAMEDRLGHLAAGVYESRLGVPSARVPEAIRAVLRSALSPGAVAYALAHGETPGRGPMAVLVHAFVAGEAEGSAAMVPGPASKVLLTMRRGRLSDDARKRLEDALASLSAAKGPMEVEWVLEGKKVLFLQARPFQPPPPPTIWLGWKDIDVSDDERAQWRWDAAHNPQPLSPAQAGLVELVDQACVIGIRQRVLGGYLFYSADPRPMPPAISGSEAEEYFLGLRAAIDKRLSRLGESPGLAEAIEVFIWAYQPIFGVLQPALRQVHAEMRSFLDDHAHGGVALLPTLRLSVGSMASERLALADGIARARTGEERSLALKAYLAMFGDESPTWDVMSATYAEVPETIPVLARSAAQPVADWQLSSAKIERMLPASLRAHWRELLGRYRVAVGLGEDDDWLYARLQARVRRALLWVGRKLTAAGAMVDGNDVFFLPLRLVRQLEQGQTPGPDLADLAADGRTAFLAALRAPPPLPLPVDDKLVRGRGAGGRVIGRVHLHRPGQRGPVGTDIVVVARTLLPTELPLLDAVALVTETGGILDHVAAQARERSIPAVVGATGAATVLAEGDLVLVDGDQGQVIKLD